MNLISLERIAKAYGPRVALDGVSLGINEDERIGVVGRNGAGKSTLLALLAGLTEPEIKALRCGADPGFNDKQEQAAYATVRALVSRSDLDDQEYAVAAAELGEQALVELSALVGYYATLALQLRIFRVPAP